MPSLGSIGGSSGTGFGYNNLNIITRGLVLYLDAGNTNSYSGSGTTWTDLSGQSNTGTINNGPTYSSSNRGYLDFDGTDDYVSSTSNSSTDLTGNMSCECWFKLDATAADWVRPMGKGDINNRTYGLWYLTSGPYFLYQRYGSSTINVLVTQTVSTGVWYHMAGTSEGTTHKLYLNGSEIGSGTNASSTFYSSTQGFRVGGADFHALHNGPIASVKLYNRALSADEVKQNFNAQRSRFGI